MQGARRKQPVHCGLSAVPKVQTIAAEFDPSKGTLVTLTSIIGACLFGAGSLLAIGATWDQFDAMLKILMVGVAIIACYAGGWHLKCVTRTKPRLGEALILLGALMYGAGIWLCPQIFHYQIDFSWGVLLWAMGVIPVALILSSGLLAVLSCILLNYWLFLEPYSIDRTLFWGVSSFAVAYAVRSPWALSKTLTGTALWTVEHAAMGPIGLALSGVGMWAWYLWHAQNPKWEGMAKPYLYIGPVCVMLSILQMCDKEFRTLFLGHGDHGIWPMVLIGALSVSGFVAAFKYAQRILPEWIGAIVAAAGLMGINYCMVGDVSIIAANVLMLAIVFGFLVTGLLRVSSPVLVSTTLFFLVVDVLMRYFDQSYQAIERSMFFVGAGGTLMLIAFFIEKQRMRLAEFGKQ